MTDSTPQNKALHPEVIAYLQQQDDIMRSVVMPQTVTQQHIAALEIIVQSYLSQVVYFDDEEVADHVIEMRRTLVNWTDWLDEVMEERIKIERTAEDNEEYLEEPDEDRTDQ